MEIIRLEEEFKDHWDNFVKSNASDGGLLHSWQWGEFQKSLSNRIFRLGVINNEGQLQAAALLVKHELPFEYNYLYCPRGPVINVLAVNDLNSLLAEIKKIAAQEKSFLLRVDPPWVLGHEELLISAGFRKSEGEVQPKCSLILDLSKSEEELLLGMKQKTRYNLNLASRHGVKVKISSETAEIENFWQLTKQTADRDGFKPHAKEHYKKMFEVLRKEGVIKLFIAEYENKIIGVNMVSSFGNTCTYLHGASSDIYREIMAPYLLQWQAILEAKKAGGAYYDFGGVNGRTFYNKKWDGITRFKTGFAPQTPPREYVGCFELVVNPVAYSIYKFARQVRG